MKKLKISLIIIVLVGLFAAIIKFVIGLTPGKSVIKKYSYSGDVRDFISHVQTFSTKDSNVVFKLTDTTGTDQTGRRYYMDIELKSNGHDFLYSIACENNSKSAASGTAIELVMAYDKINNIGGYNREAKGVQSLVNTFDIRFLAPLKNTENINIIPLE
jgi:hypothetical protein